MYFIINLLKLGLRLCHAVYLKKKKKAMETFGCTQSLLEKIPCQQSSCHAKDCSGTPRSGKLRRFLRKGGLEIGNSWFKKKKQKNLAILHALVPFG